mmetsp:Transcript_12457/g.45412  ORF Transcript_12457/g.45412 Transcript_12457/m.45412 type:complete len:218 (-) Transcript_12457:388-1041(-)
MSLGGNTVQREEQQNVVVLLGGWQLRCIACNRVEPVQVCRQLSFDGLSAQANGLLTKVTCCDMRRLVCTQDWQACRPTPAANFENTHWDPAGCWPGQVILLSGGNVIVPVFLVRPSNASKHWKVSQYELPLTEALRCNVVLMKLVPAIHLYQSASCFGVQLLGRAGTGRKPFQGLLPILPEVQVLLTMILQVRQSILLCVHTWARDCTAHVFLLCRG